MSTPAENPFAGQGSVLRDIGGEIGALVVAMPADMGGWRWRSGRPPVRTTIAIGTRTIHTWPWSTDR